MKKHLSLLASLIFLFFVATAPLYSQSGGPLMEDPSRLVLDNSVLVFEIPPKEAPPDLTPASGARPAPREPGGDTREDVYPDRSPRGRKAGPRESRVLFIGDIMCHGQQLKYAKKGKDYEFRVQFQRIKPYLANSMVIGNLETTFAGEKSKYSGYPAFNTPDSLAAAIVDMGVHIVTLANNHIFDKGNTGAKRTIEILDGMGLIWTGLGTESILPNQPLLVEYDGLKWALLNFSYGSNTSLPNADNPESLSLNVISEESVLEGLTKAKELAPDVIVVLFHWGNEYQEKPSNSQITMAQFTADNGADLIIGTHPHVLQPIDVLQTARGFTLVAYSLGNFVSNQRTKPRERSAILAVDLAVDNGKVSLKKASVAPIYTTVSCVKRECAFQVLYAGLQSDGELPQSPSTPPPSYVEGERFISVTSTSADAFSKNPPPEGVATPPELPKPGGPPEEPTPVKEMPITRLMELPSPEIQLAQAELGPVPGVGPVEMGQEGMSDATVVEYPLRLTAPQEASLGSPSE
ncbi:MAG: CapA family protein, partial [Deltaproteobacteria bacterium]|nr:CapA family protein [Deltaproteobacteria bacterium]